MKYFFAVLSLFAGSVFGQAVPASDPVPRVNFPRTNVGSTTTFGPMTADASNAAKFSYGVAANGAVFASTGTSVPTAGGGSVPIGVVGEVPKAGVARAIGRAAAKAFWPIQVGSAIYDVAKEVGFSLSRKPDGSVQVVNDAAPYGPAAGCYVAPCSLYQITSGSFSTGWLKTREAAAAATENHFNAIDPANKYVLVVRAGTNIVDMGVNGGAPGSSGSLGISVMSVAPTPGPVPDVVPSTMTELENAIAAKSGWPTSSALARALADALKSGEAVSVIPKTATGPSTSPGTSTVTNNVTNNTTSTSTVTNNHTYAGPSVSTSTTTINSTVNNSTGAVTDSVTVTTTPVTPAVAEPVGEIITCGLPTTPPCLIDETGVPDGSILKQDAAKDTYKQIEDLVRDPKAKLPQIPTIAWDFALPTGCAVIPLPAFEPFVKPIDVCQFRPMFHDIMTVVWLLGGLFGAISMFFKSALAD